MTVGTLLDHWLAQVSTEQLRTVFLGSLPLAALYLYRQLLHIPRNERAVAFAWTAPKEVR